MDANASVDSLATRFAVEARQALQKHLEELFQEESAQQVLVPDPSVLDADPQPTTLPIALSEEEQETFLAHLSTPV